MHEPDMYEEQGHQKSSGANKWLWGCGIGCGVLLVLVIVVGAVMYFVVQTGLQTMGEIASQQIDEQYEPMKEQADIPEDYEATYDEVAAIATGENASPWARVLALPVVLGTLEDGEVTEDEFEMVQHVAEVLRENPDAGLMDLRGIFEEHPQLQESFQQIQQQLEDAEDVEELQEFEGVEEPAS
ncbi:MAG: hypothetical protein ACLFV4_05655 [Candidatus Hydrogenedentota bacterium]